MINYNFKVPKKGYYKVVAVINYIGSNEGSTWSDTLVLANSPEDALKKADKIPIRHTPGERLAAPPKSPIRKTK